MKGDGRTGVSWFSRASKPRVVRYVQKVYVYEVNEHIIYIYTHYICIHIHIHIYICRCNIVCLKGTSSYISTCRLIFQYLYPGHLRSGSLEKAGGNLMQCVKFTASPLLRTNTKNLWIFKGSLFLCNHCNVYIILYILCIYIYMLFIILRRYQRSPDLCMESPRVFHHWRAASPRPCPTTALEPKRCRRECSCRWGLTLSLCHCVTVLVK